MSKLFPLYAARLWKHGNSLWFVLNQTLTDALQVTEDDLLLIRPHLPYISIRKAVPELALPLNAFTVEELPPAWPRRKLPVKVEGA